MSKSLGTIGFRKRGDWKPNEKYRADPFCNFVCSNAFFRSFFRGRAGLYKKKNAAGLIYRRAENAFDVKFFGAEMRDGKITNIAPVE